jgi:hypothetical protein
VQWRLTREQSADRRGAAHHDLGASFRSSGGDVSTGNGDDG